MQLIIAGSRSINDMTLLDEYVWDAHGMLADDIVKQYGAIPMFALGLTIIEGGAKGIDRLARQWAKRHQLPCRTYSADWERHGKSAGYKRNEIMAENADALLAFWDGKSKGTQHMINAAMRNHLPIRVWQCGNGLLRYEDSGAYGDPPKGRLLTYQESDAQHM